MTPSRGIADLAAGAAVALARFAGAVESVTYHLLQAAGVRTATGAVVESFRPVRGVSAIVGVVTVRDVAAAPPGAPIAVGDATFIVQRADIEAHFVAVPARGPSTSDRVVRPGGVEYRVVHWDEPSRSLLRIVARRR